MEKILARLKQNFTEQKPYFKHNKHKYLHHNIDHELHSDKMRDTHKVQQLYYCVEQRIPCVTLSTSNAETPHYCHALAIFAMAYGKHTVTDISLSVTGRGHTSIFFADMYKNEVIISFVETWLKEYLDLDSITFNGDQITSMMWYKLAESSTNIDYMHILYPLYTDRNIWALNVRQELVAMQMNTRQICNLLLYQLACAHRQHKTLRDVGEIDTEAISLWTQYLDKITENVETRMATLLQLMNEAMTDPCIEELCTFVLSARPDKMHVALRDGYTRESIGTSRHSCIISWLYCSQWELNEGENHNFDTYTKIVNLIEFVQTGHRDLSMPQYRLTEFDSLKSHALRTNNAYGKFLERNADLQAVAQCMDNRTYLMLRKYLRQPNTNLLKIDMGVTNALKDTNYKIDSNNILVQVAKILQRPSCLQKVIAPGDPNVPSSFVEGVEIQHYESHIKKEKQHMPQINQQRPQQASGSSLRSTIERLLASEGKKSDSTAKKTDKQLEQHRRETAKAAKKATQQLLKKKAQEDKENAKAKSAAQLKLTQQKMKLEKLKQQISVHKKDDNDLKLLQTQQEELEKEISTLQEKIKSGVTAKETTRNDTTPEKDVLKEQPKKKSKSSKVSKDKDTKVKQNKEPHHANDTANTTRAKPFASRPYQSLFDQDKNKVKDTLPKNKSLPEGSPPEDVTDTTGKPLSQVIYDNDDYNEEPGEEMVPINKKTNPDLLTIPKVKEVAASLKPNEVLGMRVEGEVIALTNITDVMQRDEKAAHVVVPVNLEPAKHDKIKQTKKQLETQKIQQANNRKKAEKEAQKKAKKDAQEKEQKEREAQKQLMKEEKAKKAAEKKIEEENLAALRAKQAEEAERWRIEDEKWKQRREREIESRRLEESENRQIANDESVPQAAAKYIQHADGFIERVSKKERKEQNIISGWSDFQQHTSQINNSAPVESRTYRGPGNNGRRQSKRANTKSDRGRKKQVKGGKMQFNDDEFVNKHNVSGYQDDEDDDDGWQDDGWQDDEWTNGWQPCMFGSDRLDIHAIQAAAEEGRSNCRV